MLYARCVGLAKNVAYPLTRSHLGKAKSYEPKALNETMLPTTLTVFNALFAFTLTMSISPSQFNLLSMVIPSN